MAYINTGYARYKTLVITKGQTNASYEITASFTYGATTYPELTNDQFALLSDSDYDARRTAFINYVYSQHDGLQSDCPDMTQGSVVYDVTLCPIKD